MLANLLIKNKLGLNINFDLLSPNTENIPENAQKKYPLVLFLHGFKGYKDWGFIPFFCEKLSNENIVINIDFSLNGMIDTENIVYDSELFRKNTISQQIEDAGAVIDYIKPILEGTNYFNGDIYLIGHSLGGATSIFLSTIRNDINKLVLLASISQIHRNTERQKMLWKEKGYIEVKVPPKNQVVLLDYSYQDDKDKNFSPNQILEDIAKFEGEVLIIHGKQDVTVKEKEALEINDSRLRNGLGDKTKLEIVEKCGHTFNVISNKDDFEKNECLLSIINKTKSFLKNSF